METVDRWAPTYTSRDRIQYDRVHKAWGVYAKGGKFEVGRIRETKPGEFLALEISIAPTSITAKGATVEGAAQELLRVMREGGRLAHLES